MKHVPRNARAVSGAALFAAVAASCNAIIGLEVGELAPAGDGGNAGSTSAASSMGGTGGSGTGGAGGHGGSDTGGAGGYGGSGTSGAGGHDDSDTGGAGGHGGSGTGGAGGAPVCGEHGDGRPLGARPGVWGTTIGVGLGDVAVLDDQPVAIVNEEGELTIARWTADGVRDVEYGLSAKSATGAFLIAGSGFTYLAGRANATTNLGSASAACAVPRSPTGGGPVFLASLDEAGQCRWAWSIDARSTTPRGVAATADVVVFGADVYAPGTSTGACQLSVSSPDGATLIAAFEPERGDCLWNQVLAIPKVVTVGALVADETSGSVVVVGAYDTTAGDVAFDGIAPPASLGKDLFVARFALDTGDLQGLTTFNVEGDQLTEQHGAALLSNGDLVIIGSYTGSLDFDDACPPMPNAGGGENFFIMRVSGDDVVWSRGFGDREGSQLATSVVVGNAGEIHVTGTFFGTIDLGGGARLTNPSENFAAFVLTLDERGNLLSASELKGADGNAILWASATATTPAGHTYVAGEISGAIDVVGLDEPIEGGNGNGFLLRLAEDH